MDDRIVKKLAEVEAFVGFGQELSGNAALSSEIPDVADRLRTAKITVETHIPANQDDLFRDKAQRTAAKLQRMADLYIGSKWDDPTELLEWLSFFSGAAAAHCSLPAAALAKDNPELSKELLRLQADFQKLLEIIITRLRG